MIVKLSQFASRSRKILAPGELGNQNLLRGHFVQIAVKMFLDNQEECLCSRR